MPTLWDAAAHAGLTTANVAWPATVGARITYNIPQYWRASTADDEKLTRAVSTPGVLTEAERAIGPFPSGESGSMDDDRRRAAFCSYLLETRRPQLSFCYLTALDAVQHRYGPGSPEADAALEAIDAFVGSVRAAARKAGAGEATLAVVSDHGFVRVERELHVNAALREAGLIRTDGHGNAVGWRAFAWSSGGTAAVYLREQGDADARVRTARVLQRLAADPVSGVERVLDRAGALAEGGFSDADFVVAARPGCHLGTKLEGSVMQAAGGGGAHGMLPAHREMDAAFFVAGPGVPAGLELGRVDMRDVAPTLAGLLDVSLPAADGHNLLRGRGVAGLP